MTKQKKIMRSFKMNEISGVDSPAQEGAKVLLFKRDDSVEKCLRLLSDTDGHSHLIDDTEQGGSTTYSVAKDAPSGHSHPWIVDASGAITIGAADGHTHTVLAKRDFSSDQRAKLADKGDAMPDGSFPIANVSDLKNAIKAYGRAKDKAAVARHIKSRAKALDATDLLPMDGALAKDSGSGQDSQLEGDEGMTPEEMKKAADDLAKAQQTIVETQQALEVAKSVATLSDGEKLHYNTLAQVEQANFLKLDSASRKSELAKLADSNPVVFKTEDGIEFRKNDDPRLVAMAKRADEAGKMAKAERTLREDAELAKRADSELTNLPGDANVKKALLRAVDGIQDSALRSGAQSLLKAGNEGLSKAFSRSGTSSPKSGDADSRYESLAKSFAAEHKVSIEKARSEVLLTPEGAALYQELRSN